MNNELLNQKKSTTELTEIQAPVAQKPIDAIWDGNLLVPLCGSYPLSYRGNHQGNSRSPCGN
jgi:hypothetical protein